MDELDQKTATSVPIEQIPTVPKLKLGPAPTAEPVVETASKVRFRDRYKSEKIKPSASKISKDEFNIVKFNSLKFDFTHLQKDFEKYKIKTERDFKDIDSNLEEHFGNLYKKINTLESDVDYLYQTQKIPELEERTEEKPRSNFFERITKKIMNAKEPTIKDMLSIVGKESSKTLKRAVDPVNIAKNFFGSNLGAAVVGKLTKKDDRLTKKIIDPTRQETRPTTSAASLTPVKESKDSNQILLSIYNLMRKNAEVDKTNKELDADFNEQKLRDADLRHKELLAAIQSISLGGYESDGGSDADPAGDSGGGGMSDLLAGAGIGELFRRGKNALSERSAKKTIAKGMSEAGQAAEGAVKSATKVSKVLEGARGVLKFIKKIPGLSILASGAALIADIGSAITQYEMGQMDETQLKKTIVSSLGGALVGVGGAEIGALLGGALGSVVPVVGTVIGGALGGIGGFFLGESVGKTVAEKAFDFFTNTPSADPSNGKPVVIKEKKQQIGGEEIKPDEPLSEKQMQAIQLGTRLGKSYSPEVMDKYNKQKSQSSSLPPEKTDSDRAKSANLAEPKSNTASPATPAPKSDALNQKVSENNQMKIADNSSTDSGKPIVMNNSNVSGSTSDQGNPNMPIGKVRDRDDTLGRLMNYSTRVV